VVLTSGDVVRSGDRLRVEVEARAGVYTYVLLRRADGRLSSMSAGPVSPAPPELILDDDLGHEAIYLVRTERPVRDWGERLRKVSAKSGRDALRDALQSEFGNVGMLVLQHLPGFSKIPVRAPSVATTPPEGRQHGSAASSRAVEPGVLAGEGHRLRALLNQASHRKAGARPSTDAAGNR